MSSLVGIPLVLIGIIACTSLVFSILVRRLYLHHLAKIPGPRLAALTSLYEFYYDCILGGKFVFEITKLHERYGPIVRIGPNEVHINDPAYFDQLYNVTGKLDKDKWYYSFVGSQDAGFGTSNADLHRARRKAMSRFFSSAAISDLETSSQRNVTLLLQRLDGLRKDGKPINLSNAFRCLAADTVTSYCVPEPFNLLESIDFAEDYNRQARSLSWIGVWHRHLWIVIPIFMSMPRWFVNLVSTEGGLLAFDFQMGLARQAKEAVNAEKRSDKSVLDGIVNSDLPEEEKTVDRLTQEARTLVGAGSETTGSTLETIVYFVLANPDVHTRLKVELTKATDQNGDRLPSDTLKQQPYLTAVIKEGLRLANSVSGRLSRVDPNNVRQYGAYTISPGTVLSMNLSSLHMNPTVFTAPQNFRPDRWLIDDTVNMEKNFAPFGRGARSCIGKELAVMNLYLTTANFFHRFDAELFETSYRDIAMEHDFFAPFPDVKSSGLRVLLK